MPTADRKHPPAGSVAGSAGDKQGFGPHSKCMADTKRRNYYSGGSHRCCSLDPAGTHPCRNPGPDGTHPCRNRLSRGKARPRPFAGRAGARGRLGKLDCACYESYRHHQVNTSPFSCTGPSPCSPGHSPCTPFSRYSVLTKRAMNASFWASLISSLDGQLSRELELGTRYPAHRAVGPVAHKDSSLVGDRSRAHQLGSQSSPVRPYFIVK